ncbi:hypothetical protein JCM11641_004880 [Rhodosporidiobolus odoratus]
MAISAPLPSTALSCHPLLLSLSLSSVPAPPPSTGHSDSFDDLDGDVDDWRLDENANDDPDGRIEAGRSGNGETATTRSLALSDSTPALFGQLSLDDERKLADSVTGTAGGAGSTLPDWLKETSGKVTALASGRLLRASHASTYGARSGVVDKEQEGELRVAAGCEDGTVWVFAPFPSSTSRSQTTQGGIARDARIDVSPLSPRCFSRDSTATASSSSPSSPPMSPLTGSRRHFSLTSAGPRLLSRGSSESISTLASNTTSRTHRHSSSASSPALPPTSAFSNASGRSYEVLRSASRPRKASATVSISTSSAILAQPSAHYSHSAASDLPDLPSPLPRSPIPSTPQSTSLSSPTFPSLLPHFVVSGPGSSAPSPVHNALGSKKEQSGGPASSTASSVGSVPLQKRSRSRAKGSIATGIGLWEVDTAESHRQSLLSPGGSDGVESEDGSVLGAEKLEALRVKLEIRTAGWGEVVALEVVEVRNGLAAGERNACLVLRCSGHLSLVSLLDGRVFARCNASSQLSSIASTAEHSFVTLRATQIQSHLVALCSTVSAIVPVLLDASSLVPQEALEGQGSCVAVLPSQGDPCLMSRSISANEVGGLYRRNIRLEASVATSSVKLEPPQPVKASVSLPDNGLQPCGDYLLGIDGSSLSVFSLEAEDELVLLNQLEMPGEVTEMRPNPCGNYLHTRIGDAIKVYRFLTEVDSSVKFLLVAEYEASPVEQSAFLRLGESKTSLLLARSYRDGTRSLETAKIPSAPESTLKLGLVQLYRSSPQTDGSKVTCVNMLDPSRVIVGYGNGKIAIVGVEDLGSSHPPDTRAELVGAVTLLDVVKLEDRQILIAGSASGMAGAWTLADFALLGCWTLFASPVRSYAYIDPEPAPSSKLGHTIAFISANSPVAVVSLFPPQLLFVLPGTKSAVELIATTEDVIMVLYEQGLARTCDIASRELRRSMDRITAERSLADGGWSVWFSPQTARSDGSVGTSPTDPVLAIDLRAFLEETSRRLPWASGSESRREATTLSTPRAPSTSDIVSPGETSTPPQVLKDGRAAARVLIGAIVPFGVDAALDDLLEQLGVRLPVVPSLLALRSDTALALSSFESPAEAYRVSPTATAQRLHSLVCLLRIFLNYPDSERPASEAIVYFASCLADSVGPGFAPPALDVFVRGWLDKNVEVQQASRSLFGTYLAATPDARVLELVDGWQGYLPSRKPSSSAEQSSLADETLLRVGLVATERFALLSTSVVKDLSISIAAYLEDEMSFRQAIAVELCSRGFGIWQNYVDAMSLVRQLFAIAIERNPATPNDLRVLARNATLHVAGVNTPLFMTTLIHDILNAPTAAARNATLKLLGFMIRKKPLLLYTNLPRVAEAVVKSLDPMVSTLRETVHQAATVILNELVRTYPSIDFHGKSQRLAVGTQEGAAIVFDLRTATRLYVLEGHSRPVTALSFSPDGHRLVTVSLAESRVVVWKVATGFLSMFTAGARPRQGGGSSSTPYKSYDFHVGDEALMTTAATLEWVVFDWPADRTVRLRLRETALNFGV